MKLETPMNCLNTEIAECRKDRFVKLVKHLVALRDIQYHEDSGPGLIDQARKVVAVNLPSNLLRAAAIFVDYFYGFPADRSSFLPPRWVVERQVLPETERGSLVCSGLNDIGSISEKNVVVLTQDVAEFGLHAGMAGIVKKMPDEDDRDQSYIIEFGNPEDCVTQEVGIPVCFLRCPRPGDFLENYRS